MQDYIFDFKYTSIYLPHIIILCQISPQINIVQRAIKNLMSSVHEKGITMQSPLPLSTNYGQI